MAPRSMSSGRCCRGDGNTSSQEANRQKARGRRESHVPLGNRWGTLSADGHVALGSRQRRLEAEPHDCRQRQTAPDRVNNSPNAIGWIRTTAIPHDPVVARSGSAASGVEYPDLWRLGHRRNVLLYVIATTRLLGLSSASSGALENGRRRKCGSSSSGKSCRTSYSGRPRGRPRVGR